MEFKRTKRLAFVSLEGFNNPISLFKKMTLKKSINVKHKIQIIDNIFALKK